MSDIAMLRQLSGSQSESRHRVTLKVAWLEAE
jgi:hypothetical protein